VGYLGGLALIPPLSADEFKQLEANIQRDGCTDPLTVWNGILVDGHNRYKICQKHGIAFKTETLKDCLTRDHVMVWIDERQLGRRNLDDDLVERRSNIARHKAAKTAANARWGNECDCAESAHTHRKPNRTAPPSPRKRTFPTGSRAMPLR
jgi:hypothetical protein